MNVQTTRSDVRRGQASGRHQSLRRAEHDRQLKQRLEDVRLDDRGEAFEDEQRDRRSSGLRQATDDEA